MPEDEQKKNAQIEADAGLGALLRKLPDAPNLNISHLGGYWFVTRGYECERFDTPEEALKAACEVK